MTGGPPPASLTSGFLSSPHPDILTEDDVYCSCLAKTLCHVPVPVTVGFYAPFGCRLHMMLDKITSEDLGGGDGDRGGD